MAIETPSYYVQQMFSANRGDTIKEVKSDGPFGPLYWVASSSGNGYFVKMANYSPDTQDLTISIPGMSSGKLTVVADNDPQAYNSDTQTMVTPPSQSDVTANNGGFDFKLPPWSVAILAAN